MFENRTFEEIEKDVLSRAPADVDKREGSIIYDATAPLAAELAILYTEFSVYYDAHFPDTATGEYLDRLVQTQSITREKATYAIRSGTFLRSDGTPYDLPIGSRFSGGTVNYMAVSKISDGIYRLQCESAGTIGNQFYGTLFPIDNQFGLATAILGEVLIPGEDAETDLSLRKRYFDSIGADYFGGNIADYKNKLHQMEGVGGVHVVPVWNGGGTVKVVFTASDYSVPSSELVASVKEELDPEEYTGQGVGLAPIGHSVTVEGAEASEITVSAVLTLTEDADFDNIQAAAETGIEEYFTKLAATWETANGLTVRISHISDAILDLSGVIDVEDVKLNGNSGNIVLSWHQLPVLGGVTFAEAT